MTLPLFELERTQAHRLIPSEYSRPVLDDLFDDDIEADLVFSLEGATSRRLIAQTPGLPPRYGQIDRLELVGGIPNAHIVNAAFCYASPTGGRFNNNQRGAWYAAFDLETCIKEVSFHSWRLMQDAGFTHDQVTKDDWIAKFEGAFHDIRGEDNHPALDPDIETGHPKGQQLAQSLLEAGSLGIIYPSLRHGGGTNIACFRPALVQSPTKGATLTFTWNGNSEPSVTGW